MIAGVIQARIGSTRCKNKMLRNFADTNLISLALEKFSKPTTAFKLYFAAYEPELLSIGEKFECDIVQRNEESAKGERIEVVMNYLNDIQEDIVVFINPCHTFLKLSTIENAVNKFIDSNAKSMTAVVKSHTWYYHLNGSPINFLDPTNLNTKSTTPVFEVTHAFHIFYRERFLKDGYFWEHGNGDPLLYEIPTLESVDIDTELDFIKAESLYMRLGYNTKGVPC